ncbi:MAG: TIGR04211 family SH3 domain-containing protein [Gammaproteobacteria bacterium]|nr:TIGR04211 family SH3 domain-containing protein [Gammaproteobacteria bacterium]MDH5778075.1 TIGR04211 family SH3 domain-containing protein [Gammaproteobacteria bacterium]
MLKMFKATLIFLALSGPALLHASEVYINDQLRVGVRPEPSNSEAPITVVTTGEKLEVLDSDSGYLMVRTSNGVEGWVKEIYTTKEIPAIIQLRELSKNTSGSSERLQKLEKQVAVMEKANQVLNEELEAVKKEKSRMQMELMSTQIGEAGKEWLFWVFGMIALGVIGFWLGKAWHQQYVAKRLSGLRI